jgi:uncharacterized membrane protein YphA (DoxX/SURF4 family)
VAERVLVWLGIPARLLIGGVLLAAGGLKVNDLDGSVRAVNAYRLMPFEAAEVVGSVLPLVEIVIGLLLVLGMATRLMAILATLLLVAFIGGIVSAWARGLSIDCGCFGGGGDLAANERPRYAAEIVRDAGLLLGAGLLAFRPKTRFSIDRWIVGHHEPEPHDHADEEVAV